MEMDLPGLALPDRAPGAEAGQRRFGLDIEPAVRLHDPVQPGFPALDRLRAAVREVSASLHDRALTRDELLALVPGADALIATLSDRVDAALLDRAPRLRVVANYAVGLDNVDLAAARARGVVVANTPDVLTEATADQALALLLAVSRRVVEADRFVRDGRWRGFAPDLLLGRGLQGKVLGILGLGRIGQAVARRARAFGMELAYAGPRPRPEATPLAAVHLPLDALLARSDALVVTCPLLPATRGLLDARRLALLRPGALLVNVARGPIVDEAALAAALREGRLGGAGLDVFEDEPRVHPDLLALPPDRVVLAPHLGSATYEARAGMAALCVDAVLDVLAGRRPPNAVSGT